MRPAWIAILMVCAACQGARGPAGHDGAEGEEGQTGEQGANGEQGEQGLRGPAGPAGPSGRDGNAADSTPSAAAADAPAADSFKYRPRAFVGCGVLLDLVDSEGVGEDGTADTLVEYALTSFSNDDLEVRCDASFGATASPAFSAYYPAITNGAANGVCEIGLDYPPTPEDGGSPGLWHLQIEEDGVLTATYSDSDPGHPLDGSIYTFLEDDCSAFVMDPAGTWQPSTVSDVF